MAIEDQIKSDEQKALSKLNQEEGWIEKHPGWVTLIAAILVLGFIIVAVKGCHG